VTIVGIRVEKLFNPDSKAEPRRTPRTPRKTKIKVFSVAYPFDVCFQLVIAFDSLRVLGVLCGSIVWVRLFEQVDDAVQADVIDAVHDGSAHRGLGVKSDRDTRFRQKGEVVGAIADANHLAAVDTERDA